MVVGLVDKWWIVWWISCWWECAQWVSRLVVGRLVQFKKNPKNIPINEKCVPKETKLMLIKIDNKIAIAYISLGTLSFCPFTTQNKKLEKNLTNEKFAPFYFFDILFHFFP